MVSGIPDSLSWITNSKARDSRFQKQNVPGFWVPKVQSSRIPESGILCIGEWHEYRFCSLENVASNILSFYLEFRYHASFCIVWCGVVLHQSLCQHFGIKLLKDIFVFNVLEHNHLHKQKDKTTIRGDKESTHKVILQQESTDYKWLKYSLRSKRFRLVSEQRKTEERDFRFWPREKWNESQKMKEGGWGGEGRKRLQTNPAILKTSARQRTERLISSASQTMYSLRAKQQH